MTNCKLNQIFLGEIASVQNYGAFVKIPGCSQQGLVHRTQVSSVRVDDVTEVLQRGERIWCKVISIGENGKIGLSMKYVNQGDGRDLDPNGVELQRDTQGRANNSNVVLRKIIQLEAVLNTTCSKCGTKGHFSKDCFASPDGKKYELIPEIEEKSTPEATKEEKTEKKHKRKKLKKEKKMKKHKRSRDNSDIEEEKEEERSKKRKFSKERKKHKRKYSSSSSDFSDSTFDNTPSSHDVKAHKRKHSENHKARTRKCKHSKFKHSD